VLPRSRSPLVVEELEVASALLEVEVALVTVAVGAVVVGSAVAAAALAVVVAVPEAVASAEAVLPVQAFRVAVVGALLEVEAVVADTKCMHSHVDTPKSAKHEGVYRQRRHGVMRPRTAWEMVRKEALFRKEAVHLMFYAVQDYFEYREEEQKNYFNFIRFEHIDILVICWTHTFSRSHVLTEVRLVNLLPFTIYLQLNKFIAILTTTA
jgi:hypothetical protein